MPVQFRLLGPVEAEVNGRRVELGHARQRCVLAALLVDANRVVPVDVLLDRVWADRLPSKARVTLSGYVSRLRRSLAAVPEVSLTRQSDGYRLAVDPTAVDLHRFRALVAQARATAARDRDPALFIQALGLWRGQAFATLDTPWLNNVRDELAAERLAAELDRNDLALDQGQHGALLAELSTSAAAHPWDERLAGQLMLALYRCGRQADALQHYERLRSQLTDELGTDPSPPLQQLHQRILTADPTLTPAVSTPAPRQLPAPPRSFTGRTRELTNLNTLMSTAPSTVVISAVSGTAGVGKTALALHLAHQIADKFPDGQLYVNLRGFDPNGSPMTAAQAIRRFLDALQVPPQRIPTDLDAQADLYRSLLAGRRTLIVLDNAHDADHVRPLLPGTPGCLTLVTSRNQLTGLVAGQGAHPITLGLLTPTEATELLTNRIGASRVAAEPEAIAEIIDRCARLPLALVIVAARAAVHPDFPLTALADELADTSRGLDILDGGDPTTDLRTVLSWSFRTLSDPAARMFRLLGLHPGPDIATPAAVSLAAAPAKQVRSLLAELTRAHLLTEHTPGRYTFHDLLRAYATEKAHTHDSAADRRAALHRALDHYLHTADTASEMVQPQIGARVSPASAQPGVVPERPRDHDRAMAWFAAEHQVLLAAIEQAERSGFETHTWQLARSLEVFLDWRGHWHQLISTYSTAFTAAQRVADRRGQAVAHRGMGHAHLLLGHHETAHAHMRQALDHYEELGDHVSTAVMHHNLAVVLVKRKQAPPTTALHHAQQAHDLFQTTDNRAGQIRTLNLLCWCHVWLGDHQQALTDCQQAQTLYHEQACGDRLGEGITWDSLGYVHHHLGHHGKALECYQHALDVFRDLDTRDVEAETLDRIGDTHHATGNLALALETWQQALSILDELDHPDADQVRAKLTASRDGHDNHDRQRLRTSDES